MRLFGLAGMFGGEKHRAVTLSDDLAEVMRAMALIDARMNTPEDSLAPDPDDE